MIAGYGNGTGQVWSYDPAAIAVDVPLPVDVPRQLELPDNIASRNDRGAVLLCEDGPAENYIRRLDRERRAARRRAEPAARNAPPNATRFGEEFAGATFSPSGDTLFVNIQASQGITFAIWGPWGRLGI